MILLWDCEDENETGFTKFMYHSDYRFVHKNGCNYLVLGDEIVLTDPSIGEIISHCQPETINILVINELVKDGDVISIEFYDGKYSYMDMVNYDRVSFLNHLKKYDGIIWMQTRSKIPFIPDEMFKRIHIPSLYFGHHFKYKSLEQIGLEYGIETVRRPEQIYELFRKIVRA